MNLTSTMPTPPSVRLKGSTRSMQQAVRAQHIHWIRRLIWVYFILLLSEGILRKWVLPSMSNPLLIIRDPVVIIIYALALKAGLFPRNTFIAWSGALAIFMFAFGLLGQYGSIPVALFGLRVDFLHLPLIFVIAKVWNSADVQKLGRWVLILTVPMALLMVMQFRSGAGDWINTGAGGLESGTQQLASADLHIRPAATFSFVSGPIYFFGLAVAFLFYGQLNSRRYSTPLLFIALLAVLSACAVSGSRTLIINISVIVLCALLCSTIIQPFLMFRWLWAGAVVIILAYVAQDLDFANQGVKVFTSRVEAAGRVEGGSSGLANRAFNEFTIIFPSIYQAPYLGYGLGSGTNAGSALISGKAQFLYGAESEWARVVLESGPILGVLFIALRVAIILWLGQIALKQALAGNTLTFLLFGACSLTILNGQWGQPTTQGFATLVGGMCLASARVPTTARTRKRNAASWRSRTAQLGSDSLPNPVSQPTT